MKLTANIMTEDDQFFGEVEFNQHIDKITKLSEVQKDQAWLLPGFVDLHCHGGGGGDIMDGEAATREVLKIHAKHGTTSLLATTVTDTHAKLVQVFTHIKQIMGSQQADEAHILGVHLEGPFLSREKLGAQPDLVRSFSLDEILQLHAIAPIRVITVAPESGLSSSDQEQLIKRGIVIQLGHSNASYEVAAPLLQSNIESVTHLFNAMSSMHHRAPGVTGAALAHAKNAELIPDLIHVHPGAIKVALRAIDNLYFVTDATAASGMPDGEYKLGLQSVHKCANGVRLKDGTLAGSSLTMDQALLNALELGLSFKQASQKLSSIAAKLIKQSDRGVIAKGRVADLVLVDSTAKLLKVFVQGNLV
tara:strand:- start:14931 stop:16016 length:1086 start_codon:yes stop_codon:yes gene_type:complete